MNTIKIFLASSEELSSDRNEFEKFVNRKNKLWQQERKIFLHLDIWEDYLDAMSQTRLQDEYNKAIVEADIFVMLFWTKVGKYTSEEFEVARSKFLQSEKPLVFTYCKSVDPGTVVQDSLEAFKKKLLSLDHFVTNYQNKEGLLLHFSSQLDKLYSSVFSKTAEPKIDKKKIVDFLNNNDHFNVFESLNDHLQHKNDQLNVLEDEFISPSNNFNMAQFNTRLRMFINKQK